MAKRLNPTQIARACELREQGADVKTIAWEVGCAPSTVWKITARIPAQQDAIRIAERNKNGRDRNGTPYTCKGCVYRKRFNGSGGITHCSFACDTGELRGSDVFHCTHYKKQGRKKNA